MLSPHIDARRSGLASVCRRRGLYRLPAFPHNAAEAARLFCFFRDRVIPIAILTGFVLGLNLLQLYAVTHKIAHPTLLGPGWDCFKSACIKIPDRPIHPHNSKEDETLAPWGW